MLNRIINIAAGSEYKNSSRSSKFSYDKKASLYKNVDFHDSINISPAVHYFTKYNWKLKELIRDGSGKIRINFSIEDFDFSVVVDLADVKTVHHLDYEIAKIFEDDIRTKVMYVEILVGCEKPHYEESPSVFSLTEVRKFFDRLITLNIGGELSRNDTTIMNRLTDGFDSGLKKEFDQLNNRLLIFIEKYSDVKFSAGIESDESSGDQF